MTIEFEQKKNRNLKFQKKKSIKRFSLYYEKIYFEYTIKLLITKILISWIFKQ